VALAMTGLQVALNDTLSGNGGNDQLAGRIGDDILTGGAGGDRPTGSGCGSVSIQISQAKAEIASSFHP